MTGHPTVAPWLHVLVPAYGASPFLAETLRSVLGPADDSTSVTVVDDGTPSDEVAAAARAAGTKVEYVRLESNRGVAGAFQSCADLSRGTYTVILGSDDLWEPSYLAVVRDLVSRFGKVEMVTPSVTVVDGSGRLTLPLTDRVKRWIGPRGATPRCVAGERLVASLVVGNWLYFPAIAWRTDVLRRYGFRQDMDTALDLDLELRIAMDGGVLAWSPDRAFCYRRHAGSVSSVSAAAGTRFGEERELYRWVAAKAGERGWWRGRAAARLHPTSRLHALLAGTERLRRGRR